MLSLALSVAVLSSSGGLLTGYQSQHVRLIDTVEVVGGAVLGQAAYAPAPQSLEALKAQVTELEETMPSFTMPIVLAASGVGLLVTMLILNYALFYISLGVAVIIVLGYIAGVVLAIIGGVTIGTTAGRRGRATREITRLKAQITQLEGGGGGYQPLPTGPTPPPPPSSQLEGPESSLLLAEF